MRGKRHSTFRVGAGATAALLIAGGCYEHTVSSSGFGSNYGQPVQPVYRSETALDHAFDRLVGNDPPAKKPSAPREMPVAQPRTDQTAERRPD